ncbi:hypothetical protein ACPPVU_04665 [Mucilaginibacter sp. McL0603]|uniref:hypothetical protein n=1 Tax=Mucilaginibacter sp. McL0603 TaxID=3415670 RepID=UPI003CE8B1AF
MVNESSINDAITFHLSILFTDESTSEIERLFGKETVVTICDIAAYATNDVTWSNDDNRVSHHETINRLKANYPFLTDASLIKIADAAAFFWK